MAEKPGLRVFRKSIPAWVAIVIAVLFMGLTVAIVTNSIPVQRISLYQSGGMSPSNFTLQSQQVNFQGPNRMTVTLILKNTAASPQTANVTVYLLNATQDSIMNETLATGSVAAGSTVQLAFLFSLTGITNEYSTDFIQVADTT